MRTLIIILAILAAFDVFLIMIAAVISGRESRREDEKHRPE